EVWRQSSPAGWRTGAAGASSTARRRPSRWHRLCDAIDRRCVAMKPALTAAALLLLAGPAMAAPGDPRAVRGNLEWPAVLSAEPFIVLRGDDGRLYYADVARAPHDPGHDRRRNFIGGHRGQPAPRDRCRRRRRGRLRVERCDTAAAGPGRDGRGTLVAAAAGRGATPRAHAAGHRAASGRAR